MITYYLICALFAGANLTVWGRLFTMRREDRGNRLIGPRRLRWRRG